MFPCLIPDWPVPAAVRSLTTFRHAADAGRSLPPFDTFNLGNASNPDGDHPAAVAGNRARLVTCAALPSQPYWLRQVHGTRVLRFDRPSVSSADVFVLPAAPEADAAVTSTPDVVLAILTADCLPVLFCADDGSEVAAVHAGWRGLADAVLEATLAAMQTRPSQLLAWLGPAAGPAAYEVGDDVRTRFVDADPAAAPAFVATRPGHWLCDLYALARRRLQAAGVSRIHGGDRCTISEPGKFFSHRRDRRSGRMASLIWIARD